MKEVEIKRFDPLNLGKVMLYMIVIPAAMCMPIGLAMTIVGIMMQKPETIILGAIIGVGYPLLFIVMYGVMGIIMAYLYNWLAGKYGGLIVNVQIKRSIHGTMGY